MDQYNFEKYLDQQPKLQGTEAEGRIVKNAFDVDERVVLPANYWRYVDWVVETVGEDMDAWIKRCDMYRDDKTLSENLMEWLYWDMCNRVKHNAPFPPFLSKPTDYQD